MSAPRNTRDYQTIALVGAAGALISFLSRFLFTDPFIADFGTLLNQLSPLASIMYVVRYFQKVERQPGRSRYAIAACMCLGTWWWLLGVLHCAVGTGPLLELLLNLDLMEMEDLYYLPWNAGKRS
jgi:hypothetical protein